MAEYLARVTWESIRLYQEELRGEQDAGGDAPRLSLTDQYGSDQRVLDNLAFGDGLWLFTAPVFGQGKDKRTLPPSVLGRISITHQWSLGAPSMRPAAGAPGTISPECETRMRRASDNYFYWCCGIAGDALPIHNAFSLFKDLTFEGRVKRVNPTCEGCNPPDVPEQGPFGHLMQHFQSIRRLTDESVLRLNRLKDHVAAKRTLFLSHRHIEAGSIVQDVSGYLRDQALCWWDVQALPQSRQYPDETLQDMLRDGIRQAGWFVAFLTPSYAETRWTYDEWNEARDLCVRPGLARRPKTLCVMLGGELEREGPDEIEPIDVGKDPETIAAAIQERFDASN